MPPYHSQYYSRSRWSGWSGFSLRFVGALVVFAVAALTGAVIGGVSVYLINDAVSPPPSVTANTNKASALAENGSPSPAQKPAGQASGAANGRPVRTVGPVFPPPSSTEPNAAAPAATETATQPPAENSVTSTSTQAGPTAPQPPAATQPQSAPASTAASQAPQGDAPTTAPDAATHDAAAQAPPEMGNRTDSPRKTAVTRKRVTATNARQRTYYDYYDRDNDEQRASAATSDNTVRARPDSRARRGAGQTQQRIIVRRQDDYDRDGRGDRDARSDRSVFPAQPRPSFFGLFGDRHYDNDRGD
jgi:hypothetical protein